MGSCYSSVVVNAPVDRVWLVVRDFHRLDWAGPIVVDLKKVGAVKGTEVGAERIINGLLHEKLINLDDTNRELTYRVLDGPGPVAREFVSDYVATLRVLPVTVSNTTFVDYRSTYQAKDEAAVEDLVVAVYSEALEYLARHFATKS